jgi:hypothetical protein
MSATAMAIALPSRVRLADGRVFDGTLPPERHRSIHLGMLHDGHEGGYVEITPGTRPPDGKLALDRRPRREHFLPRGGADWLGRALEHIAAILEGRYPSAEPALRFDPPREEVFVGVTARTARRGRKAHVAESHFLWVDIDEPEELPRLWELHAQRPAHLIVFSGGSGGAHAYWRLAAPLPARTIDEGTGATVEWIERANQRLIHHLGRWITVPGDDGKPKQKFIGADRACADRSRVMRLAGTVNHKTGEHARIAWADLQSPGYDVARLVGDLPDMPHSKASGRIERRWVSHDDPYKRIPPAEYFERLAGIEVSRNGLVSCPSPHHPDREPSCKVGSDATQGWYCLAGETRVLTANGARPIAELAGSTHRLLTTGGVWVDAPVRSFGEQPLRRVVVGRNGVEKELFATPEHRWLIALRGKDSTRAERTTEELSRGRALASVFPIGSPASHRTGLSPFGVAHGITFGDGTRDRHGGSRAMLYGAKDRALLPWFPLSKTYAHSPSGGIVVADLPGFFKELPALSESPSYLYGWLAGYFAADGDVNESGSIAINCADRDVLEHVRAVCTRLRIGTFGIASYRRDGYGSPGSRKLIHRLRLMRPRTASASRGARLPTSDAAGSSERWSAPVAARRSSARSSKGPTPSRSRTTSSPATATAARRAAASTTSPASSTAARPAPRCAARRSAPPATACAPPSESAHESKGAVRVQHRQSDRRPGGAPCAAPAQRRPRARRRLPAPRRAHGRRTGATGSGKSRAEGRTRCRASLRTPPGRAARGRRPSAPRCSPSQSRSRYSWRPGRASSRSPSTR